MERMVIHQSFSIGKAYYILLPIFSKVPWSGILSSPHMVPKHKFILWLTLHGKLSTMDRLAAWGKNVNSDCSLCKEPIIQSLEHLFFACNFSTDIWNRMLTWAGENFSCTDWNSVVTWATKRLKGKSCKKALLKIVLAATVYTIWQERNARRFQHIELSMQRITHDVVQQVHIKAFRIPKLEATAKDLNWYP